jgi:CubicO group peptidase (beta-lactamase class C family)
LRESVLLTFVLAQAMATAVASAAVAAPAQAPVPPAEGFSTQRLQRLDDFLRDATDEHGYLGAVTLIVRHGRIVESRAFGHRDLQRRSPMQTDAIFRIYSMTKTIASVAALILMEEGKLALDDPVGDYLPEFAAMQVFAGGSADAPRLRAVSRKLTIHHLLTHTAGFATADTEPEARRLLERADLPHSADLKTFAGRLARVPLAVDPGTRFKYDGVQIEVLARVIEVVAGMPFDEFLKQRILDPLHMDDTGFSVPAGKRSRIADITSMGKDGKLVLAEGRSAAHPGEPLNAYPSGAGGLYSTASDYARFCRMLLDGGELDGASILGRKTVELMMQNHLTMLDPPVTEFSHAEGFGLGGSVLLDVAGRGRLGSAGQFGWTGAASTYYTIDPKEGLIAILLLQHLPRDDVRDLPRISNRFYDLVYQALTQ